MTRTHFLFVLLCTVLFSSLSLSSYANDTRYSYGYTVIDSATSLDASIDQPIFFDVANCGSTVLEALGHVLTGTGYVLAPPAVSDERIRELYDQPIPDFLAVNTGMHRLSDILKALGGSGWVLVENPVSRQVSFRLANKKRATQFQVVK